MISTKFITNAKRFELVLVNRFWPKGFFTVFLASALVLPAADSFKLEWGQDRLSDHSETFSDDVPTPGLAEHIFG